MPAEAPRSRPTLAKIVATIGPASDSPELVGRLIQAGVSVFRLNFSHGTLDQHAARLRTIREVAKQAGQPVGVLGDLQGPKIRVGQLPEAGVTLQVGQDVVFTVRDTEPFDACHDCVRLPTEYEPLIREVKPGHRVLVNDGAIRLLAVEREAADGAVLRCRVMVGGLVTTRKGINLPDSDVKASAITQRDWECVEWAVGHGLDFLALSFVRRALEIRELKVALEGMCSVQRDGEASDGGAMIPVIAKIEKPQALDDLDAIVEIADGIMVARGDLGVEMDMAQVPMIQKRLIAKCDEWGKPCIVATQMLETMVTSSTPTRAEASDVANAILDGADAVMLSAETATGKHPALVVETMRRIVAAAEDHLVALRDRPSPSSRLIQSHYRTAALAHGAWYVAHDIGAKVIACWSQEGGTARYLSQTGLQIPVVAYSNSERHVRRMSLLRGITPRSMAIPGPNDAGAAGSLASWNDAVEADLGKLGWISPGDPMVLLAGRPLGQRGATTAMAVHYAGNRFTGFFQHT